MTDATRREFLQLGGVVYAAAATTSLSPAKRILTTGHLSPLATEMLTAFGDVSPPDEAITHSNDRVSAHIPYEEGGSDAVEEWTGQNDDRNIIAWNEPIDTATVVVPRDDLLTRWGTPSLAEQSWRDGVVDLNLEVSRPDPVDIDTIVEDEWGLPTGVSAAMRVWGDGPADSSGLAFDDAKGGPIKDARGVTGAPDTLVDGASTGGISVAVVDTGFNTAGGDILGNTGRIRDESMNTITDGTVGDEGLESVADGDGHGTHVSSTIAANPANSEHAEYSAYLPDSDLIVLKALGDDGSGSTADIARAITHGADAGADVMCLSLGSPLWSVELERALAYAVGEGCIPVVAAGNDGMTPNPFLNTPADAEYAISVSACEVADPENARHASFSSRSPDPGTLNASGGETADARVHIAATGTDLDALVANRHGDLDTEALSGTSMAAPCVVGGIGLLLAETTLDADDFDDVQDRLTTYSTLVPKQGEHEAGAGMLDVQRAIDENEPDETQAEARDDDAVSRDHSWEALSDAYGRRPTRWLV